MLCIHYGKPPAASSGFSARQTRNIGKDGCEVGMSVQLDDIIVGLSSGQLSLETACHALSTESQADPIRTRFWGQRIEAEMVQGRLSRAAARALFDSLEDFQSDKTVWLDSAAVVPRLGLAPSAPGSKHKQRAPTPIKDLEQLRAMLFGPATRPAVLVRADSRQRAAATEPASSNPMPSFASRTEAADSIPIGTVLNERYRIIAPLGLGGVGQVFDAIDLRKSKERDFHVTVKVVAVNLRHQPLAYAALETAVRRSQSLVHPNIVAVYDIDQNEDQVFIVMESLRGRWLSGLVREVRGKGFDYDKAWPIVQGIASGLAYAHDQGVVHCDLSPHAVFLCEDGMPKIMGFGLVHAVPNSNESLDVLDTLTLRAYTEAYTADAWSQAAPHAADDLYPLGVIAYELLAGVHPFQRCTLAVARQKGLQFTPIPGLNRRARNLIERCLSFERKARPQDGAIFLKGMRPNVLKRMLFA
jgi:hypothetical protein